MIQHQTFPKSSTNVVTEEIPPVVLRPLRYSQQGTTLSRAVKVSAVKKAVSLLAVR